MFGNVPGKRDETQECSRELVLKNLEIKSQAHTDTTGGERQALGK